MAVITSIFLIIVAGVLLSKLADLTENTFVFLSRRLKVSPFLTGFSVIGLASCLPELTVAIVSSVNGTPDLSVGNILGGTILLLSLGVGYLTLKQGKLKFDNNFAYSKLMTVLVITAIFALSISDGLLTQVEGFVIVLAYLSLIFSMYQKQVRVFLEAPAVEVKIAKLWFLTIKAILGIVGMFVVSKFLVEEAELLARSAGIPAELIGILLVSVGSNLPELVLISKIKTADGLKLVKGALFGSAAAHSLVVGLLALISPGITVDVRFILPNVVLLTMLAIALLFYAKSDKKITAREGAGLVLFFTAFVVLNIFLVLFFQQSQ